MNLIKRIFRRKPREYLLDNTYRIVEAFQLNGTSYYMHEDPMNVSVGRGLSAMQHLEELIMRCSADYLKAHIEATDKILSDREKIDLGKIYKLNDHLKQRVNLLIAIPGHVYKLASIVYFTKEESPFRYDPVFNKKKIDEWEKEDLYDFFCKGHLKNLIPSLALPENDSLKYSDLAEKINKLHLSTLSEILSNKAMTLDIKN
jgi:hypothetical protein